MGTRRRFWATALVSACVAVSLGGTAVLGGGGFAPTVVLRTAADGRQLLVSDIGIKGKTVAVLWEERHAASIGQQDLDNRLRYRISTNGGKTFAAWKLVDTRDSRFGSADICDGTLWTARSLHRAGDPDALWHAVLDGVDLDGSGDQGYLLTDPFADPDVRDTDLSCIGSKRLIVGWTEEDGATDDVRLDLTAINPDFMDPPPDYEFGPFDADAADGVSVAATSSRAYAAWVRPGGGPDGKIRFKRFTIAGGPDSIVGHFPILTLPDDLEAGGTPQLAADGNTVVLAYTQQSDLFVRRSTNGGLSFGARKRLIDVPFPSEVAVFAQSADIRGSKVVIHATMLAAVGMDLVARQFRVKSNNGGTSWSSVELSSGGDRIGGYSVVNGETRLVEAWDKSWNQDAAQKLRFQRHL